MLVSLEDWMDAPLQGAEGLLGKVEDFLFDDGSWEIRYLVVNAGNWLGPKRVVLPVEMVQLPSADEPREFISHVGKEQVRNSPTADSLRPVSRQQEAALRQYYGWPSWWGGGLNSELPPVSVAVGREFAAASDDNPHLRSVSAVLGYNVWTDQDLIGRAENYILADGSWCIGYIDVRTGDWLRSRSVLVSTRWVKSISWGDQCVRLENHLHGASRV